MGGGEVRQISSGIKAVSDGYSNFPAILFCSLLFLVVACFVPSCPVRCLSACGLCTVLVPHVVHSPAPLLLLSDCLF